MADLSSTIAAKVREASLVRRMPLAGIKSSPLPADSTYDSGNSFDLVVIGCSTGGPAALGKIVAALPKAFYLPIVVAQHMPVGFTGPMAMRLDSSSAVRVVEASQGMEIVPGTVYIAPAGFHTGVKRSGKTGHIEVAHVSAEPGPYRPSVNYLFRSAVSYAPRLLVFVLTGMGQDGLEGCALLRASGACVVAESAESAVIYGMPRAVAENNLVDKVLPLPDIIKYLSRLEPFRKEVSL